MKKLLIGLCLISACSLASAQSATSEKNSSEVAGHDDLESPDMPADYVGSTENADLQIRQKPGTEGLLADYLKAASMDEDTVYALMYTPSFCPRCEVSIPGFYQLLKADSPDNKMLLITVYGDSAAASSYNGRKGYKADYYLYDTYNAYREFFSLNTQDVQERFMS